MIATAMATVTVMTTAMAGNHCSHNHYKCDNKQVNKGPPERDDKAFKPCHLHGPKSQHIFETCFRNPKNQDKKSYNKKPVYKTNHNGELYGSTDKESRANVDLPAPSNGQGSPSEDEQHNEGEQYHVHFEKKVKVGSHVPCKEKALNQL